MIIISSPDDIAALSTYNQECPIVYRLFELKKAFLYGINCRLTDCKPPVGRPLTGPKLS